MRAEIFVVLTELSEYKLSEYKLSKKLDSEEQQARKREIWALHAIKYELVTEFGGLTETGTETGYWSDNGIVCEDSVQRWLIYGDSRSFEEKITEFNKRIKIVTHQKSQAFGIDGKLFFV